MRPVRAARPVIRACVRAGGFSSTCDFRAPIFESASQMVVLEVARQLIDDSTYLYSLCPYECGAHAQSRA